MAGNSIEEKNQVKNQTSSGSAPDEGPMANLPPTTKLDQEPNPFEQSFSGAAANDEDKKEQHRPTLPPVASITSPTANNPVIGGGILPKEVSSQFTWDTLRTGPLSPSMLQGPANPDDYYKSKPNATNFGSNGYLRSSYSEVYNSSNGRVKVESGAKHDFMQQQRKRSISQQQENDINENNPQDDDEEEEERPTNRKRSRSTTSTTSSKHNDTTEDEKRKNFLERNRIAALKCRQRKKQWLNNLQAKVEFLTSDNERLQLQSESLKEEIVNLKTLLLAHKECPVARANGFQPNAIQKSSPMPPIRQISSFSMASGNRSSPTTNNAYQHSSRINIVAPTNNQSMVAGGGGGGGSSSVMRL